VPPQDSPPSEPIVLLKTSDGSVMASADLSTKPIKVSATGFPFLNRFIEMENNAGFSVSLIKALLREGKVVVFPEYLHGLTFFDNVFTRIGPAASSLVIQLFLFLALAFYTFNKRFGQPLEERIPTPGSADFVSASAELLKSARATDLVLETALHHALQGLTRTYGIPSDLPIEEKIERLPASVRGSLQTIYQRALAKPSVEETIQLLKDLERVLNEPLASGR
jgi:hypothetical protein